MMVLFSSIFYLTSKILSLRGIALAFLQASLKHPISIAYGML